MNIDIYIKKTGKEYSTTHGIPFQCVELVRRFFSTLFGLTFPDVVDAVDLFSRINKLDYEKNKTPVDLITHACPFPPTAHYSQYFKPGTILFWKYKKTDFKYGHVAIILDSNERETTVIQQNLNPPVKLYNTKELFEKMTKPNSKFAGVKIIPEKISEKIKGISYKVIRL